MQLFHLLSFALLAAANERCCDEKCYKALDNAPRGHSASADCRAFQITTVTPCPTTVTKTAKGSVETVTVTSTYGKSLSSAPAKAVAQVHAKRNGSKAQCASTGKPAGVPGYATQACHTSDYASACSCLGVTKTTTTLPRSTHTTTEYDCSTTTTTKTVTPTTTIISTTKPTTTQTCAANSCFGGLLTQPIISSIASDFCKGFITVTDSTVTATATTIVVDSTIITPPAVTPLPTTVVTTVFSDVFATSVCTSTVTSTVLTTITTDESGATVVPTTKYFISRSTPAAATTSLLRRAVSSYPSDLVKGCPTDGSLTSILSSACSCVIKPTTTTTTTTLSITAITSATAAASTLPVVTGTSTITPTTIVSTVCGPSSATTTATVTSTVTVAGNAPSCGIALPAVLTAASGQITCSAATAGQVNEYTRIEGNDGEGLVFEGCIASGPEEITTPSGGTHLCDGTNDGANPNPGANGITQIQSAAVANDFTYDGTFDTEFDDFFIQRIGDTDQTGDDFWGILTNQVFTAAGGCETEVQGGSQELLWAFNAFNVNYFLTITPAYAMVPSGSAVQITVHGADGNGDPAVPIAGAAVYGTGAGVSDASGVIEFFAPLAPGCYQYKATRSDSIRSNIFYLTVF